MTRTTSPAIGRAARLALLLGALALAGPASAAEPDPGSTGPTAFGAQDAARPAAAGDLGGMLAVCDQRLDECVQDYEGVDFLAAAYLALWVILVAFFFMVRARQRRLTREIAELRARLGVLVAECDGAPHGSSER